MNDSPSAEPPPKTPPPPLMGRAPRPSTVRIRKPVIQALALGAAGLLAGALAWAFVIQPDLRTRRLGQGAEVAASGGASPVRPPDAVIEQPASYDRLPDRPGISRSAPPAPASAPVQASVRRATTSPGTGGGGASADVRAASSGLFFADSGPQASSSSSPEAAAPGASGARGTGLLPAGSPHGLTAGAIIPAVLLTGIDTSRPGPVVAAVSQNVFDSITGRHLLVPQGSRLFGRHEGESAHGDRRAFLVWERLILPNGDSVALDDEPGVDALGRVGVEGRADRRLFDLGIAALTSGLLTTVGEYARGGADDEDPGSFPRNAGDAASVEAVRLGGRLIDRETQTRPVIRVDPGAPVRAMVTRNLVLEPYQP